MNGCWRRSPISGGWTWRWCSGFTGKRKGCSLSLLIGQEQLSDWNVTVEEVARKAMEHMPRLLPVKLCGVTEELERTAKGMGLTPPKSPEPEDGLKLYLLTNQMVYNGAAVILYEGVLKKFAEEVGKDLILLPSSVHEVLLLPDDGDSDYEALIRTGAGSERGTGAQGGVAFRPCLPVSEGGGPNHRGRKWSERGSMGMTFEEFSRIIRKGLQEQLEDGISISLDQIKGNNGTVRTVLTLSRGKGGLSPRFDMRSLYEQYQEMGEDWEAMDQF